ncbi:DUF4349 domain-containing protein [Roseateles sp. SL47]|uniref:DUF4349 domain-containing protein n=1 Tax=Roseateles sp. SL47 TaxID=2995138 RepID=UPI00227129F7|nr:DUF4349 domain-containing protein [Roseateles sp. SL47]WAC71138.1 DUF4349 domain-containing protein [Roseateles sp. SL47]
MIRMLLVGLFVALATGCYQQPDSASFSPRAVPEKVGMPSAKQERRRTLAYAHTVEIDVPENKLASIQATMLKACQDAAAQQCEVLESQLKTGEYPSAFLKLRARPEGIRILLATVGQQGDITGQSTTAEDLGGPIRDSEKKLSMLKAYRDELEALRKRQLQDADSLIKITRELAEVQNELEDATGVLAVLEKRVDTELLSILIEPRRQKSFWKPISSAASDFGGSLSRGISSTIIGVAFLLPWTLLIGLLVWVGRKLWRRRNQA